MKTDRNGRIRLAKNEVQAGNWVVAYHEKSNEMSVQDIGGMVSWRVSAFIGKGAMLKELWRLVRENPAMTDALKNFCFADHYALGAVVPAARMPEYVAFITECIKANRALYGLPEESSEEDDAKALESVRGMQELQERLEGIPDKE